MLTCDKCGIPIEEIHPRGWMMSYPGAPARMLYTCGPCADDLYPKYVAFIEDYFKKPARAVQRLLDQGNHE